jgi:hypothetical protein
MRFALHSDAQDTLAGATLQHDLGVGDVRSTMESLGVYLFAGVFLFLASAWVGALPFWVVVKSRWERVQGDIENGKAVESVRCASTASW